MGQEAIESAVNRYPKDRDLRTLVRQLTAAQNSGKKTKPIKAKIDDRLLLLQNGGPPTELDTRT